LGFQRATARRDAAASQLQLLEKKPAEVVVQALAAQKAGPGELAEIRRLLKDYERGVK